jgi:hypothetical protein
MKATAIDHSMGCDNLIPKLPRLQKEAPLHQHQWTISRVLSAW